MLPLEIGVCRHWQVFHTSHVFRVECFQVAGGSRNAIYKKAVYSPETVSTFEEPGNTINSGRAILSSNETAS